MASSNNQANDWVDLPHKEGDPGDWQDIPQRNPQTAPDAADKAAQGNKPNAVAQGVQKAKAFAEGAGQGMTLGNVGNVGGAVQALAGYLGKPGQTDRDLQAKGFKIQEPSGFDIGKKATNDELDQSYKDNPWSYRAGYVGGSTALAKPGRAIYDAAGGGIRGGAGLGAVQGYLTDIDPHNLDNQIDKAGAGMALGGAMGVAGAGANALLNFLGKKAGALARFTPAQSQAYLEDVSGTEDMAKTLGNPSEDPAAMAKLQDRAAKAIQTSKGTLTKQGLEDNDALRNYLRGRSVKIDPNELLGIDPRVDEMLQGKISAARTTADPMEAFKQLSQNPEIQVSSGSASPATMSEAPSMAQDYREIGGADNPSSASYMELSHNGAGALPGRVQTLPTGNKLPILSVPAEDANQMRGWLQESANFGEGTATDPVAKARYSDAAVKAAKINSDIDQVAPEAAGLRQDMKNSLDLQTQLARARNSPIAFVSSESPDRMATLARAEKRGAGGLFDLGNQIGAAKSIAAKDTGSALPASWAKAAGRAGLRGVSLFQPSVRELSDFPYLQQIIQESSQTK